MGGRGERGDPGRVGEARTVPFRSQCQAFSHVPGQYVIVRAKPGKPDMAVGTQKVEGGLGDTRTNELPIVDGIVGNHAGEHETVVEVAQPFSVAPLAAEDEDLFNGDEDLAGQLDTLNERELERFDQLLSARYSLS